MKHIDAYCMARGTGPLTLCESVTDLIAEGWQPFGSPYVNGSIYLQAMVKVAP